MIESNRPLTEEEDRAITLRARAEDQANYPMTRTLSAIAAEIRADWRKPYFGAVPYLNAMRALDSIEDNYYEDSAKSVVLYFLSNASTWRGETARRIKAELKAMVK
jgi:hypothetical protein